MAYPRRNWAEDWDRKNDEREELKMIEREVKINLAEPQVKQTETICRYFECDNGQLSLFQIQPKKPMEIHQTERKNQPPIESDVTIIYATEEDEVQLY